MSGNESFNVGDVVESIYNQNNFGEVTAVGKLNLCINHCGHLSVINIADVRRKRTSSEKLMDRLISDIEDTKEHSAWSTASQIIITLTKYYDIVEK